jgi:peroxiredoxin
MAYETPICDFGWKAVDFELPGVDGGTHRLADVRGPNGTLIMFICNHCPYVKSVLGRIVETAQELAGHGIGSAAICANDAADYAEDSFDNMRKVAMERGFGFPYLHDEPQVVARAYGAACTPDFFGFNAELGLQYRGRLDASRATLIPDATPELLQAMIAIAETGEGPLQQIASMGCSIKWKAA